MDDIKKYGFFREKLIDAINRHPKMSKSTRRLLTHLALKTHNGHGDPNMLGACYPSRADIKKDLSMSEKSIANAYADAEDNYGLGIRQYANKSGSGTKYFFDWENFLGGSPFAPPRYEPDAKLVFKGRRTKIKKDPEGGESPQPEGDESTTDDNHPTDVVDASDNNPSDSTTDSPVAIDTTEVSNGESSDDEWRDSYVRTSDAIEEEPKQSLSNQAVD